MGIDIKQFRKEMRGVITKDKNLQNLAYGQAINVISREFDRLANKIREHDVSKEINAGEGASSKFLPVGNLFSFIGFENGESPVEDVIEKLDNAILVERTPTLIERGGEYFYHFPVQTPTNDDLEKMAPLKWDKSKGWITELESGIRGLVSYIYRKEGLPKSRSGTGLQAKGEIRSDETPPVPYISALIKEFIARFRR